VSTARIHVLNARFMKQDAAAEQEGMSGKTGERPDGSKYNEEPTIHSRQVLCQNHHGNRSFIFDGMQRDIQKLENAPDISSLVGESTYNMNSLTLVLTRYAVSFLQSSRMTSITLICNNSANPRSAHKRSISTPPPSASHTYKLIWNYATICAMSRESR
jgi:hypothetical protein